MTGYDFHPEARFDLDEIWEYISADNVEAADRVIAKILSRIRAVVPFPHSGHRRPDLTGRPLRFLHVREYLIACSFGQHDCKLFDVSLSGWHRRYERP